MTAIRVHEYGDADTLNVETVPCPRPGKNEILVRVSAAGVNPIDWMVREGYVDDALDPSLPYIPGWDLSGTVTAVGEGVTRFSSGDSVFGLIEMPEPGNAYAEYASVPANHVVRKPDYLDHIKAAAVPMVGLTAWRALFTTGELESDQQVLIHAGAGGVGHMAVQFADHIGAEVIATASGRNETYLRDLGVDEFVNYRDSQFEKVVDGADLVVDAVGGETLDRSVAVLNDGGSIVTLPEPPTDAVRERARSECNGTVEWFSVQPDTEILGRIRGLLEDGHVEPTVSDTFPLTDAHVAHRQSQDGHVRGKLVLTVRRSS
jgi:NADPH:quinone reductase-like Zn-dependent oxidoreductase